MDQFRDRGSLDIARGQGPDKRRLRRMLREVPYEHASGSRVVR
jgi:hypothetical protein